MFGAHFSKQALQQKHWDAERQVQRERMRRRDEKRAGRAGPPDVGGVGVGGSPEAKAAQAQAEADEAESVGGLHGWDMLDGEDVRSPGSCHPPCTSRTPARCSVS
jgi:hypothetical protein